MRKCNTLRKMEHILSFYSINGKIMIEYEANNGNVTEVITHENDLREIFGEDLMVAINRKEK